MGQDTTIIKADPEGVGPRSFAESLFDPTTIGEALYGQGWDSNQAIEILASIARDTVNNTASERMKAVKALDEKAEKALQLHGIIRRISLEAVQDDGETKKTLTAEGLQLIKDGTARTLSTLELLEAGSQTTEIIDVEPGELPDDPRTDGDVRDPQHTGPVSGNSGPSAASILGGARRSGPTQRGLGQDDAVHGTERTSPPDPTDQGECNDQTTTGGAEDERSSRTPVQSGGSRESCGLGEPGFTDQRQHQQADWSNDSANPKPTAPGSRTAGGVHGAPRSSGVGVHQGRIPPRTTPYTPGEARRRAARANADSVSSGEPTAGPDADTPRAADGTADARATDPRIRARFLSPGDAATGFPGDADSD